MQAENTTRASAHDPSPDAPPRFGFIGGDPSVDLANTVDWWPPTVETDRLHSYDDLLDWSEQAGLIDRDHAETLRREASIRVEDAERVFRRAYALRERFRRVFVAAASGESQDPKAIEGITTEARRAAAHSRLVHRGEDFRWALDEADHARLDWPVWALARAALALLTSESLRYVRECANDDCQWMFIDRSRNHSRRWCDMAVCGNRAKARRNYARQKTRHRGEAD